jgi:hypothetical protein
MAGFKLYCPLFLAGFYYSINTFAEEREKKKILSAIIKITGVIVGLGVLAVFVWTVTQAHL